MHNQLKIFEKAEFGSVRVVVNYPGLKAEA